MVREQDWNQDRDLDRDHDKERDTDLLIEEKIIQIYLIFFLNSLNGFNFDHIASIFVLFDINTSIAMTRDQYRSQKRSGS